MKTSATQKKPKIPSAEAQLRRRAEAKLPKQQKNLRSGAGALNPVAETRLEFQLESAVHVSY